MTTSKYLRARSDEQKEERRRHLLDTAKLLLLEIPDVHALGINELARYAQMTKSNVYRYFESSEAVLLTVLVEEFMIWRTELRAALSREARHRGTVEHIVRAFTTTVAARPLLCRLISVFPSILERNISAERMVGFKHGLLSIRKETALDFHSCMPSISASAFEQFIHQALPLLIGLWPLSNPAKVAAEVIARPELVALRYDFERDLEEGLLMLLRGRFSE
ncbi:TetR/AcrR family transcriptional regulator [Dickeya solani]|uniref:TetR family transcriptional regulator n=1 Tax=Dickeya solani TaxID=1089444 RepID=A0ABU4EHB0_9GAMM|nr:TetR family transcriptional regulator [Dickeya solani]MCA6997408.1 TetR family transcriptional regulator [Dickeya solani]MCZ0823270.1 TetR family transcriptional regulator [Dickeya solani]MDV6995851.1 TetR family transcriptional regulator [Dickeya solani]MDV7002513.1 TetR family transcriptional regulator [Dickeya solani]MDV7040291.1 TetR family transcriptional regulator [Dickeya solani]